MPPFPKAVEYLYAAWGRMRSRKAAGMAGPAPIEWHDLDAFLRLTGTRLAPWEIRIIERLDDTYLRVMAAEESDLQGIKQQIKDAGKQQE